MVHVLNWEKAILQRDWMGYYEDGSSVRYRETWTPVTNDTFEWKIERFINGDWQLHLAPDSSKPSIHRVDRSEQAD